MSEVRLDPPLELSLSLGEAMFTQRAMRRLKPDPIPESQLEILLNAASKAPNGGNMQPARFLAVRDRARVEAFGELYREAWWAKRRDEGRPWTRREDIPADSVFRMAALLADEIRHAPVVVLAFGIYPGMGHSVLPAMQNLMLAARALGIGSTLTTLHPQVMERVYALFGVPEKVEFHGCIPLGYPRGRFGPTPRLKSSETTYIDAWSQPPPW
ncbi:MAG: nitroreductase family protein [Proteobacteria bacterium]|nr:nitroreductase family protein [Pseudomonadota bacterium]